MLNGNLAIMMILFGFVVYSANSNAFGRFLVAMGIKGE